MNPSATPENYITLTDVTADRAKGDGTHAQRVVGPEPCCHL